MSPLLSELTALAAFTVLVSTLCLGRDDVDKTLDLSSCADAADADFFGGISIFYIIII
jgi:hypothetical protein